MIAKMNAPKAYGVLGLSKAEALTEDMLKSAYKKAARKWHPDLNTQRLEEAHEKFKEIQDAYNTLLFMLQKEGGDLPPGILNAHEFFKHFGHDHLAKMTEETLEEISLTRAAYGMGADGSSGGFVGALDGKLMQKMKLWARGPDFRGNIKILDTDGHFTDVAVRNILEFAFVYERADTDVKRRRIFGVHEVETSETDPYDVRLAHIIREWVYNAYVRTASMGWIHKSKAKYLVAKLGADCLEVFAALGVPTRRAMEVSDALAGERFEDCARAVDAIRGEYEDGGDGGEGGGRGSASGRKKKASDIKALRKELETIASKVKIPAESLGAAARSEEERAGNILLDTLAERIIAIEAVLAEDAQHTAGGGGKGKVTGRAEAAALLRGLAEDIRALARVPDSAG